MDMGEVRRLNLALKEREFGGRKQLAARLGHDDNNYLNQLLGGHSSFGQRAANKISARLELPALWLETPHPNEWEKLGDPKYTGLVETLESVPPGPNLHGDIPEISFVTAGERGTTRDPFDPATAQAWHSTTRPHSSKTYALRVVGQSMWNSDSRPSYHDGDIIIVDPEQADSAVNGDRIVARLDDDSLPMERRVTFKSLAIDGPDMFLLPLNSAYKPMREPFVVLGKVIGAVID